MNQAQNKIYNEIDKILWFDWDPMGINNTAARNTYEAYVLIVFGLKISGANLELIARKLYEIETDTLGAVGDLERYSGIARKIYNLED